jgi:hypothetical protein
VGALVLLCGWLRPEEGSEDGEDEAAAIEEGLARAFQAPRYGLRDFGRLLNFWSPG